jgi:hypothetical protein
MKYRTRDLFMCSSLPIQFCEGLFPPAISRGIRGKTGSDFLEEALFRRWRQDVKSANPAKTFKLVGKFDALPALVKGLRNRPDQVGSGNTMSSSVSLPAI